MMCERNGEMMITTAKRLYKLGELRVGWASWDDGSFASRSIKFAYRDSSGKISRGAPEISFETLVDMVIYAKEQGELSPEDIARISRALSKT